MSNKDEELLESILRETEGRHAQRPVQQPAEQSREQYGAEPASASEPGGTFRTVQNKYSRRSSPLHPPSSRNPPRRKRRNPQSRRCLRRKRWSRSRK